MEGEEHLLVSQDVATSKQLRESYSDWIYTHPQKSRWFVYGLVMKAVCISGALSAEYRNRPATLFRRMSPIPPLKAILMKAGCRSYQLHPYVLW